MRHIIHHYVISRAFTSPALDYNDSVNVHASRIQPEHTYCSVTVAVSASIYAQLSESLTDVNNQIGPV
jgi:hypothetical protein